MSTYIEDRVDDIEVKLFNIENSIFLLARHLIKEPIPHTQECIDKEIADIITYGYRSDYCTCNSERINTALKFEEVPILSEEKEKELLASYKRKQAVAKGNPK